LISADESESTAELSEADRAAWLRIERALRGMRWWMLFLATVAVMLGTTLLLVAIVGVAEEGMPENGLVGVTNLLMQVLFVLFVGFVCGAGAAIILAGALILRTSTASRKPSCFLDTVALERFTIRLRVAWISITLGCAAVAAALAICVAAATLYRIR